MAGRQLRSAGDRVFTGATRWTDPFWWTAVPGHCSAGHGGPTTKRKCGVTTYSATLFLNPTVRNCPTTPSRGPSSAPLQSVRMRGQPTVESLVPETTSISVGVGARVPSGTEMGMIKSVKHIGGPHVRWINGQKGGQRATPVAEDPGDCRLMRTSVQPPEVAEMLLGARRCTAGCPGRPRPVRKWMRVWVIGRLGCGPGRGDRGEVHSPGDLWAPAPANRMYESLPAAGTAEDTHSRRPSGIIYAPPGHKIRTHGSRALCRDS